MRFHTRRVPDSFFFLSFFLRTVFNLFSRLSRVGLLKNFRVEIKTRKHEHNFVSARFKKRSNFKARISRKTNKKWKQFRRKAAKKETFFSLSFKVHKILRLWPTSLVQSWMKQSSALYSSNDVIPQCVSFSFTFSFFSIFLALSFLLFPFLSASSHTRPFLSICLCKRYVFVAISRCCIVCPIELFTKNVSSIELLFWLFKIEINF